jgi:hypothetical protein
VTSAQAHVNQIEILPKTITGLLVQQLDHNAAVMMAEPWIHLMEEPAVYAAALVSVQLPLQTISALIAASGVLMGRIVQEQCMIQPKHQAQP